MIQLKNVSKGFESNHERIEILKDINLTVGKGEKVAIIGPSGSGKTTLLSLIAGLDKPDKGSITVDGKDLAQLGKEGLALFRNQTIGIIFQSFELIAPFTALENIMTPLEISGLSDEKKALEWLESVELVQRREALPQTLSGGEKQRVAIARAMVMGPQVILADEPTGSLDRLTGGKIIDMLINQAEKNGTTVIIITHDPGISGKMDRVFELRDQTLYEKK